MLLCTDWQKHAANHPRSYALQFYTRTWKYKKVQLIQESELLILTLNVYKEDNMWKEAEEHIHDVSFHINAYLLHKWNGLKTGYFHVPLISIARKKPPYICFENFVRLMVINRNKKKNIFTLPKVKIFWISYFQNVDILHSFKTIANEMLLNCFHD